MTTLKTLLRDVDPLAYEPRRSIEASRRSRQIVLDSIHARPKPACRIVLRSAVAALVIAAVGAGTSHWTRSSEDLIAAIRFEIRVAAHSPAPGLEAVSAETGERVYLHQERIVVNGDIAEAHVVPGDGASTFNVAVLLTPEGAVKMEAATERNLGLPIAIVVDGEVVAMPTVRGTISDKALITGNFTEAEAERIATGILGK
jgi:hypothetical protein